MSGVKMQRIQQSLDRRSKHQKLQIQKSSRPPIIKSSHHQIS
jgi:hypothetical protein